MFKPSDLNRGAWIFNDQLKREAREARRDASSLRESLHEWKHYANRLKYDYSQLASRCNDLQEQCAQAKAQSQHDRDARVAAEAEYARLTKLQVDQFVSSNNEACEAASAGIVVAGYTNNIAMELTRYRNQLIAEYTNGDDEHTGLPFGQHPGREKLKSRLTIEQGKRINLRLLCRMEWFDWCLHNDVLAKYSAMMAAAIIEPTIHNIHLRNRKVLDRFSKEAREYNDLRQRAMNPETSESVRNLFEANRLEYWTPRIGYEDQNLPMGRKYPYPSLAATKRRNIHQRFDLHLPAGRIARDCGINIETGKKAHYYRQDTAASTLTGHGLDKCSDFFLY